MKLLLSVLWCLATIEMANCMGECSFDSHCMSIETKVCVKNECICKAGYEMDQSHNCRPSRDSSKCLSGWGDDADNCYPQDAVLECSATGFKLTGLTTSIMYESPNALKSGHAYGILANGKSVGTFDESGDVTIEKTWNDITDFTVTHATDSIKFEVEISAEDPAVKVGDVTIHTTRTESFKIICSYSDKVKITLDDGPIDVNIGAALGTSGSIDETKDVWSSAFDLNVYSEDSFTTKITTTEPISLGSPIYGKILATDLPTVLQYFVSNCEAKASDEESETSKMSIFNHYECFNPIFGDSESIFDGRTQHVGSKTDYKFSFPAFTFNVVENDQLHLTCEITICPADGNCIAESYSSQRGTNDDTCNALSTGFKMNTISVPF